MFFHHLKNFSPYSGHIYNEMKAAIVRKKGTLISKSEDRFDLIERIGYFPFRELRRNDQAYFISDMELFDFFQVTEEKLTDYHIDYYSNWNFEAKELFVKIFLNGYRFGLVDFKENIGLSYSAMTHDYKMEYLRNFCLYCLDFLYFDGELDEALFSNLGYIQASLYLAFVEINNLKVLSVKTHLEAGNNRDKNDSPVTPTVKPEPNTHFTEEANCIEVYCDVNEIKKIWQVLTEPIITSRGTEQAVFNNEELEKYLGAIFCSGAFPDVFKFSSGLSPKATSRGDMRNILLALMYSCYTLNRRFNRSSSQMMYVVMLKKYFSVFATSEVESIKSVFSTYVTKGLDVLKNNLGENQHIEEMLAILKKHQLRH